MSSTSGFSADSETDANLSESQSYNGGAINHSPNHSFISKVSHRNRSKDMEQGTHQSQGEQGNISLNISYHFRS